jgi:elongation factor 1 alpha-like protein
MEVATKTLSTDRYDVVINDAPGHADYVPSMITGTAAADAAVVVVDATDFGTSLQAGQLREHLLLAKGLGISQLIFAINKMDLLAWSPDAYNEMLVQLEVFAQHTLGYSSQKVQFLPLSGLTGVNVVKPPLDIPELLDWYKGPTLWQALDRLDPPPMGPKLLEKPLRLIVTDIVGETGKGIAIRGKLMAGWVESGEPLVVSPVQDETSLTKMVRLQASSDDDGREKYAVSGDIIDAVLPGIDPSRISVGHILGRPGLLPPLTTRCRAKVFIFEGLTVPIIRGSQAILHMHYLDVPCHLSAILRTLKPSGGVLKERPRILTGKVQAVVEITLHYAISMEAFEDCRALGRFVLRRGGVSIAVGRVEEVFY